MPTAAAVCSGHAAYTRGMPRMPTLGDVVAARRRLEGIALRTPLERSPELAEASGAVDQVKNALYLLGAVYREAGEPDSARSCFSELRERFYPSSAFVAEFLFSVDIRRMINLRAA